MSEDELGLRRARNALRAAELEEQMRSIATPAGRCQFVIDLLEARDEHGNPAPLISKAQSLQLLLRCDEILSDED